MGCLCLTFREEPLAGRGVARAEPFKQKFEGSTRRRVPEDPALCSLPERARAGSRFSARPFFGVQGSRGIARLKRLIARAPRP
jgi:hypothetical protein